MDVLTTHASTSGDANPLIKLRAWQRFHVRLTGLYGGTVLVCLLLIGFIFYASGVDAEIQGLQKRLLAMVSSLAASVDGDKVSAIPLDSGENSSFHRAIKQRFQEVADLDPDVATIYILRPTNEPTKLRFLVDYVKDGEEGKPGEAYDATDIPVMLKGFAAPAVENEPYTDQFGTTLSGYAPIYSSTGKSVGIVGADVHVSRLTILEHQVRNVVVLVFGIAVLLISLVSLAVAHSVRTPLSKIINAAAAVARGDYTTRIDLKRNDEFGLMSQHFNNMVHGLKDREFIRETFGRYMSHDLATAVLSTEKMPQLGGEERVVTVLFSDLRGYSTMAERLPPVAVVEMLNEYLGEMNVLIDKYHGCVIEFLGDAILAVFGAPSYQPDHSENAVRCAMEMRVRLAELNQRWSQSGLARYWKGKALENWGLRIGIHAGPVVAGNIGSPTRMKYTVIGDTVNVAARLENLNKTLKTDVLISDEVYDHLPDALVGQMKDQGQHQVKGREQSVSVYSLEALHVAKVVRFSK